MTNDKDWTVDIPNPLIQPPNSQVGTGAEDREVRYMDGSKTKQRQMTGTGLTFEDTEQFITYDPQPIPHNKGAAIRFSISALGPILM